jgi:hypothetical protein
MRNLDQIKANMKSALTQISGVKKRLENKFVDMAIDKAKVTIAKQGLNEEDLTQEQKEIIVNDEMRNLKEKFQGRGLSMALLLLGITTFDD